MWKVGLTWPSGKKKKRRCWVSYPTLPGQLGPILYSSVILQTILCLVLFLLFVLLFSLSYAYWIGFFFFFISCTPLDVLLHLALSVCAAASFELMYPDTVWWACSSTLFFFLSNPQSSLTGTQCQHISHHWVKVQQCLQVHHNSPPYMQVWLVHFFFFFFWYYRADFPQPLRGQVHCVDYLCNSCE